MASGQTNTDESCNNGDLEEQRTRDEDMEGGAATGSVNASEGEDLETTNLN